MFAIDHAATALLLKRHYSSVPMLPLLLSVQAMEIAWVGLNYFGVERTSTEPAVHTVADIHLAYMPYSHSVATSIAAALIAWLAIERGFGRAALGRAVGVGIVSHLLLDLLTHQHDIAVSPGLAAPMLGLDLYGSVPILAFSIEFAYGIVCWRVYRGGRGLLAVVVLANLANLSLFSRAIAGPEEWLAGHPMLIVSFVAVQIVVTLALVGVLARRKPLAP